MGGHESGQRSHTLHNVRPREEQELYRGAFTAWVTERAPWSPDEARMFKVKGQQLTVEDLLAELDEDTARVPRSPAAVRQVLGLDEGATWTDAAQAARARLPKGGEDGPVATTQYPSAETIAQLALQAQQAQWDYVNSLDNKASGLLALDGLILTLLFTSGVTRSQWNLMLSIGAAALGAATLLLLAALAARGLERNPNVIALRERNIGERYLKGLRHRIGLRVYTNKGAASG